MRAIALSISLMFAYAVVAPRAAQAATDQREMRARENFAAGRYQEALELFAKLYAEKLHPNYLRNIGRCYQNLGDADKAITSFRDYLRRAKNVPAEEKAEVEGYIAEMEALKKQKEASSAVAATTGTAAATTTAGTTTAVPVTGEGASSATTATTGQPTVNLTLPPPPPPEPATTEPALYEKWWFWAIVGGAAAAGIFTKTENAMCPMGRDCPL